MATDIRSLFPSPILTVGKFLLAQPQPGLTVGRRYFPIAMGVDCLPANPVIYVLVANDAAQIVAVQASQFTFELDPDYFLRTPTP